MKQKTLTKHLLSALSIVLILFIGTTRLFAQESITVDSPKGNETWAVETNHTISWTWTGTINFVNLYYSPDNFATITNTIKTVLTNTGSYEWKIPDNISSDFRFKVKVADAGNPAVYGVSNNPFKIMSNITPSITTKDPNTPPNAPRPKNWVVTNETATITWTATGTVPKVTILYSTDNFVANIQTAITNTANTGSYDWKIPDAKGATVKIRVYDARDVNLITGAGAYGETAEFMIDYYHITFHVLDDVTRSDLNTFKVAWNYVGLGDQEFGPQYYQSPIAHDYPYGRWTTAFTKANYSIRVEADWTADRDKDFNEYMESSVVHQWQVMADINYNKTADRLEVTAWFMRDGLLMSGPDSVTVDIYDFSGALIKTLASSSPDGIGVFRLKWDNPGIDSKQTYLARITITYAGKPYTSAVAYNVSGDSVTVTGSSGESGSRGSRGSTSKCGLIGLEPLILLFIIRLVRRRKRNEFRAQGWA